MNIVFLWYVIFPTGVVCELSFEVNGVFLPFLLNSIGNRSSKFVKASLGNKQTGSWLFFQHILRIRIEYLLNYARFNRILMDQRKCNRKVMRGLLTENTPNIFRRRVVFVESREKIQWKVISKNHYCLTAKNVLYVIFTHHQLKVGRTSIDEW